MSPGVGVGGFGSDISGPLLCAVTLCGHLKKQPEFLTEQFLPIATVVVCLRLYNNTMITSSVYSSNVYFILATHQSKHPCTDRGLSNSYTCITNNTFIVSVLHRCNEWNRNRFEQVYFWLNVLENLIESR